MITQHNDKLLFTPGPLTTSDKVKQAMNHDLGSRDQQFTDVVKSIQHKILDISHLNSKDYAVIFMQGSGTFGIESVLSSISFDNSKWLVIINGGYAERMVNVLQCHHIAYESINFPENELPDINQIEELLKKDEEISHIAIVHCETTTGIVNDIETIGQLAKKYNKTYVVDAMSSFGGIPIDFNAACIDYLISSPNKCLQGVPGFAFIIARQCCLETIINNSKTICLNLYDQWKTFETTGQFRFTPPIQVFLACDQALDELISEGGIEQRQSRYNECQNVLYEGMQKRHFKGYLAPHLQSCINTTFYYLDEPYFNFQNFYHGLKQKGFLIYSGKITKAQTFRIGTIGCINKNDIDNLLLAVTKTIDELKR